MFSMSFSEFLHSFLFSPYERQIYLNTKEFYGTYYDAMELLKIAKMKNRSLVIIAKTNFCSLILQMLVRYVGLKLYLMWTTSKSIHQEFSQHTHLHICLKNLQITFRR